jgi:hypothetical protein
MPDPIADPTPQEDTVHMDERPQRPGMKKSRKDVQAALWARRNNRELNQLSQVLATEDGQAVIMRILDRCHIYFEGHLDDAAQGRRVLGVRLIKEIMGLSPDSYPNLLLNHGKRMIRWKSEDEAAASNAKDA